MPTWVSLTLDVGYLFTAALAKHSRLSLPWMWGSSSQPLPRMGKTGDVFKKIRDTKGSFHAKMVSIKDRNDRDLTEAEDIKKRWQKYTEELCKKDLHNPDNHDDVITLLEPDILECKVRWALGSITTNKASGGDGIPAELFQILKDELLKCCTYCASKSGKLSSGHRTKVSFHSNPKERQCQRVLKLAHNCTHL